MIRAAIPCFGAALALAGAANASVVISNKATKQMSCSAGVCTPTAKNAVLNAGDLQTMLASSDVTVNTGAGAISISVSSPVTWGSSNRLTLHAQHGVAIRSTMIVEGTSGLTITLDDGAAGALNFYPGGSITFWDTASSLIINANAYILVKDIKTLASNVESNWDGYYALANDYDASGDGDYYDAAVTAPLFGTFEGLGHTISNFTLIPYDDYESGLFAEIDGTVRDVSLTGGDVTCTPYTQNGSVGLLTGVNTGSLRGISVAGFIDCPLGSDVGGVAGDNTNPAVIENVTAKVSITGTKAHYVGGLVGVNTGTIENSSASGGIYTGVVAGGLVGSTQGILQDSHATGRVSNSNGYDLGGLAGTATSTILRCFATGNISSKQTAGGLVGSGSSNIDSSFATGTVVAGQHAGGLVGSGGNLTNTYSRGAVTVSIYKTHSVGGLVGTASGFVTTSYSTGAPSGGAYLGGLVGQIGNSVPITGAYWDLDSSGVSDPSKGAGNIANYPGITGLTDTQLKSGLPAGFNPAIWGQSASINNGCPYLLANPPQ